MEFYIDVILPIPVRNTFTYGINADEARFLKPGMRVLVSFGKSKVYTALVYRIHRQKPGYETKEIQQILDQTPIVTPQQLAFWEWMADYYLCSLGEVMKAALSRQFLLESETLITLNRSFVPDEANLTDDEWLVLEALQLQNNLRVEELQKILGKQAVLPLIHCLAAKNAVVTQEEVIEQYKPKLVKFLRLHPSVSHGDHFKKIFESLNRAPKQKEAVMALVSLQAKSQKEIKLKELLKEYDISLAVIKVLIEKNIFEVYTVQHDRLSFHNKETSGLKTLSGSQQKALQAIENHFQLKDTVLLHGVTSGGKTEVYSHLIQKTLQSGKQVLFMLPEIALTTQLIERLSLAFGQNLSVYHSRYSVNERIEVWHNVLNNKSKAQLVVGARSSLFLPFHQLGLIIVDEEHEPSYKQFSPAPRYHARDTAVVLAKIHQAKVLLGSATPSIETHYNATQGKYGLAVLSERYGNVKMPEIKFVNLREKYHKKKMKGHFSETLLEALSDTFSRGNQAILFQNRRGYSPTVECQTCGHAPLCPNCDVTLTYHRFNQQLRCHYCGYHIAMQQACMACGSHLLDTVGLGTEQIEEELKVLFPDKKVARMDQDTTQSKNAFTKIITAFEEGETDILVGTQMVAKGLDFRKVGLVGVMNADNLLNFPDFRSHERCYQLLTQVAGRAGRTDTQGQVLIQTYNPHQSILRYASTYNYQKMYQEQLQERLKFKYPPFYRLIKITVRDRKFDKMHKSAQWLAATLKQVFKENLLGPEQPPVGRVRNEYITHLLVKISKNHSLTASKSAVLKVQKSFLAVKDFRSVKLTVDVDCY